MIKYKYNMEYGHENEKRIRYKSLSKTFVLLCVSFYGSYNLTRTEHYE